MLISLLSIAAAAFYGITAKNRPAPYRQLRYLTCILFIVNAIVWLKH